jgi:TetR/AcrR family transcriptional regulator, cholesterol catabolism regulator
MAGTDKAALSGAQSRAEILAVFTSLVAERGYDAVSVNDIALELGISKGTILHHFSSKERLLEQVHAQYMRRRLRAAALIVEEFPAPADQVCGLVYEAMIGIAEDRDATIAFAREIVRFSSSEVMEEVRRQRAAFTGLLHAALASGMSDGTFISEDPSKVTLQIFGALNWSWTWYRAEGAFSAEDFADSLLRVVLRGLGSQWDEEASRDRIIPAVRHAMATAASEAEALMLPAHGGAARGV